jgi:hypothetical protein
MKLLTLAFVTFVAFAQEPAPQAKSAPAPKRVTRVMEFILDDGEKMRKIAELFAHRLQRIQVEPSVGLLVMTGWEEDVNEVEAAIKRYYKPKPMEAGIGGPPNRNFELVLHILQATSDGVQSDVPSSLQPSVQQLRQLTNLTSFRAIESQIVRIRSGEKLVATGILRWPNAPVDSSPNYEFEAVVKPRGVYIQCDQLKFRARIPFLNSNAKFQYTDVAIQTAVDLKPGQATIIGKTNASLKDGSVMLVLTAKLVD